MKATIELVCPECKLLMIENNSVLVCKECSKEYEVINSIPVFSTNGEQEELLLMESFVRDLESASAESFQVPSDRYRLPIRPNNLARRRSEYRSLKNFFKTFPDLAEKSILNISSGCGRECKLLLERGAKHITLLDISYPAVEYSKKLFAHDHPDADLTYIVSDASVIPFRADSFDIVYIDGSAHHYNDLQKVLSNCLKVAPLVYFIAEPAVMGWMQQVLDFFGWNSEYGDMESHRLSETQVKRICKKNGFKCDTERLNQYYPRILDRFADNKYFVNLWFIGLRILDLVLPHALRHSLNVRISR